LPAKFFEALVCGFYRKGARIDEMGAYDSLFGVDSNGFGGR
jgi:hypothetical protein